MLSKYGFSYASASMYWSTDICILTIMGTSTSLM